MLLSVNVHHFATIHDIDGGGIVLLHMMGLFTAIVDASRGISKEG